MDDNVLTNVTEKPISKESNEPIHSSNESLFDIMSSFFEKSAQSIYSKASILGSCPIRYAQDYPNNMPKEILQTICQLALKDFISSTSDKNKLFSISINLKVSTTKEKGKFDAQDWCEGYTMCCAFDCTNECTEIGIWPVSDKNKKIKEIYNAECAKTFQKKMLKETAGIYTLVSCDEYSFINDDKPSAGLPLNKRPHHGLSFSERFIEQIEFNNLIELDQHGHADNTLIWNIGNKRFRINEDASCAIKTKQYSIDIDSGELPYLTFERQELAELFDDGTNAKKGITQYPSSPIQHRNQAVIFPIECQANGKTKRIGYLQLTAYYNNKTESKIFGEDKRLSNEISKRLKFFCNWVLLANKIFSVEQMEIDEIHKTIHYKKT